MLVSQAVLPHMIQRRYGRLLHVASIAGKEGNAGMTAYSATKAGLIGMVKSLAKDYVEQGITINALAPAVIRTAMVDALPQATVDYMTAKIPMKRCGELDEAAKLIAWIVSPVDLIPEFIPGLGPLDDVIVAVVAMRYVRRRIGFEGIRARWSGSDDGLRLLARVIGE